MAFKAVISDLDGVIVNTVGLHFNAWKKMFNEYGKEFSFDDYKQKVDGIPRADGCRAILTGASDSFIKEAGDKKQAYYLDALTSQGIELYDTTILLFKDLISRGIKVAVISSSKNLSLILERAKIKELFSVQISGNDITKGKPDPQIFLMAAQQLMLPPEECVIFEDATLGIEAGKRAGMLCVGIDRDNKPELFTKADIVVKDLKEVDYNRLNSLFDEK